MLAVPGDVILDTKNIRETFYAVMTVNAHYMHFYRFDGNQVNIDLKQRIMSIEFSNLELKFDIVPNTKKCFTIKRSGGEIGFCPNDPKLSEAI